MLRVCAQIDIFALLTEPSYELGHRKEQLSVVIRGRDQGESEQVERTMSATTQSFFSLTDNKSCKSGSVQRL